jgi:hydrogenase/urease accessory protein HupE
MLTYLVHLLLIASPASAHPLGFGVLELHEDHYALRVSPEEGRDVDALRVHWPAGCVSSGEVVTRAADGTLEREGRLRCGLGLRGELAVEGLGAELTVLVRVHRGSEVEVQRLDASRPSVTLGVADADLATFVLLGIEHAGTGLDHLLFLVGVVFLARTARRVVLAVTAFTVGHAITLGLATYGVLSVSVPTVELGIALSLVALAHELSAPLDAETIGVRQPALLSGAFGLLHGLGFATALGETGLPPAARVVPLIGFHIGIEVVQLAVVLVVLGALHGVAQRQASTKLTLGAAYVVGTAGVVMIVERL